MKATLTQNGCTLTREPGDKRIGKESTVVFHMRNLLNAQGLGFRRIYPERYGLNSCKLGLANKGFKTILWHERYAIELAHEEFNKHGEVFFMAVHD
jgi:hypothetical protein